MLHHDAEKKPPGALLQERRRGKEGKGGDRYCNGRDLLIGIQAPEGMGSVHAVGTGSLILFDLPWGS